MGREESNQTNKKKIIFFSKNIADSPHCACGAVETTKHH